MIKLVKVPTPGMCRAMRCKKITITEPSARNPFALCFAHHVEWVDAGEPDLAAVVRAEPGAGIVVSGGAVLGVPADRQSAIETERQRTIEGLARIQVMPLVTQADVDRANLVRGKIADRIKEIEADRTSITKPILDAKKAADAVFVPLREAYEACEKAIRSRLLERLEAQQKAERDARALVQDAGGIVGPDTLALAHGQGSVVAPEGVSVGGTWVAQVDSLEALFRWVMADYSARKDFVFSNLPLLHAHAGREKDKLSIPGVSPKYVPKITTR